MRLTEPCPVSDTFVSELVRVERLKGGNVRFTHAVETVGEDGEPELVVVAKIVMHVDGLAEARRLADAALNSQAPISNKKFAAAAH